MVFVFDLDDTVCKTDEFSEEYILKMAQEVKAVNGVFITLFHNQHLTNGFGWEGWKEGYKNILKRLIEYL